MKKKYLVLLAITLNFIVEASGPKRGDLHVEKVTMRGDGCSQENAHVYVTSTDGGENSADYFEVIFEDFVVQKGDGISGRERNKRCRLMAHLRIPKGYKFALGSVVIDGYADIDEKSRGIISNRYSLNGRDDDDDDRSPSKSLKKINGPYSGPYCKKDLIKIPVWSKCGGKVKLALSTRLSLKGPKNSESLLTLDEITTQFRHKQKWEISWKKCKRTKRDD